MNGRADRARWMLNYPGVVKRDAAAAMGVDASAVSRIIRSERRISEEEFERLQKFFRAFRGDGFEEPFPVEVTPTPALSPVFPARAVAGGDWVVDLVAAPEQQVLAPGPFRGLAETYGFRAPDNAAWPRYKHGEIVWVAPTALVLPGDDVIFATAGSNPGALRGRVAELRQTPSGSKVLFEYASREGREVRGEPPLMQKLAPRDN